MSFRTRSAAGAWRPIDQRCRCERASRPTPPIGESPALHLEGKSSHESPRRVRGRRASGNRAGACSRGCSGASSPSRSPTAQSLEHSGRVAAVTWFRALAPRLARFAHFRLARDRHKSRRLFVEVSALNAKADAPLQSRASRALSSTGCSLIQPVCDGLACARNQGIRFISLLLIPDQKSRQSYGCRRGLRASVAFSQFTPRTLLTFDISPFPGSPFRVV
jgi:hypothetical protein